ncbi:MAG: hypothetical protein KatS3mg027_1942 [Bacteroidia bacterium]|nr:MAG: hypothetical protein KatS3mg027_1942 [Bacteroidia bacterium]
MATTTAVILVGKKDDNHGGIIPHHLIQLFENDKPNLLIRDLTEQNEPIVIIPTVENMVHDIYLIIASLILKKIDLNKNLKDIRRKSFYNNFSKDELNQLYFQTMNVLKENTIKVVFNILDGSTLVNQLDEIRKYPNDFEVTLTTLKKEFNSWSNKIETKGL